MTIPSKPKLGFETTSRIDAKFLCRSINFLVSAVVQGTSGSGERCHWQTSLHINRSYLAIIVTKRPGWFRPILLLELGHARNPTALKSSIILLARSDREFKSVRQTVHPIHKLWYTIDIPKPVVRLCLYAVVCTFPFMLCPWKRREHIFDQDIFPSIQRQENSHPRCFYFRLIVSRGVITVFD